MTNDNLQRFTFRLPDALYAKIGKRADELGVSRNALILQILWEWAEKHEQPSPPTDKRGGTQ